jgi:hypothetical protein
MVMVSHQKANATDVSISTMVFLVNDSL